MISYKNFLIENKNILLNIFNNKISVLSPNITFESFCKFAYEQRS